eukprot:5332817-Pleurochrysis_carterae.AAC.4
MGRRRARLSAETAARTWARSYACAALRAGPVAVVHKRDEVKGLCAGPNRPRSGNSARDQVSKQQQQRTKKKLRDETDGRQLGRKARRRHVAS